MNTILIELAAFSGGLVFASFGEWTLHRFLMHGPKFPWKYPYTQHQKVHHKVFEWHETYLLHRKEDTKFLTFAWWNVPLLLGILGGGIWLAKLATGWPIFWGAFVSQALYYASYETLHYAMHAPRGRWFERTAWFRWINHHHWVHHRYFLKNLNVVLPLADLLLGTRKSMAGLPPAPAVDGLGMEG
jgi:hypothetical protein